jgi:formylglycine-generating enzyme required for sulfatase activity
LTAGTPLVIGIFGKWGTGKTSLMNLIQCELENLDKLSTNKILKDVKSIRVEPWKLTNREQIWTSILQLSISSIHKKLDFFSRITFDLKLFFNRINLARLPIVIIKNLIRIAIAISPIWLNFILKIDDNNLNYVEVLLNPPFNIISSILLTLILFVHPSYKSFRDQISLNLDELLEKAPFEKQISTLQRLNKEFEKLVYHLIGENGRLIIFIDDLDRCIPKQIPEVLEAIKLFATTKGCIYIMALDLDIVRKSIKAYYGFEDDKESTEFLEKIIQVPFNLPPIDQDRIKLFIDDTYPNLKQLSNSAFEVFCQGLEPNPRKIKRTLNIFFNLLDLSVQRANKWAMDPVHPGLVAKIVLIQSRFPVIYQRIVDNPGFLFELQQTLFIDEHNKRDYHYTENKVIFDKEVDYDRIMKEINSIISVDEKFILYSLLAAGNTAFPPQEDEIATYIYLIGTIEGEGTEYRPTRKERSVLLGDNEIARSELINKIKNRFPNRDGKRRSIKEYNKRIIGVLKNSAGFNELEIRAAIDAIRDFSQEVEPEMVFVINKEYKINDEQQLSTNNNILSMFSADIGANESDSINNFNGENREELRSSESPIISVNMYPFFISKYPITNRLYKFFIDEMNWEQPDSWNFHNIPPGFEDHPVTLIDWMDANSYCIWLQEVTGKPYRLPTENEWEVAAGPYIFPWGNNWDKNNANTKESGIGSTKPIGFYSPRGDSMNGITDMAGNVLEWCIDSYNEFSVAKGGSYAHDYWWARRAARAGYNKEYRGDCLGFRVVLSLSE